MLKRNAGSESGNEGLDADINPPLVRSISRARNILFRSDSDPNATSCSNATFGALCISAPVKELWAGTGHISRNITGTFETKEVVAYS
jgi:hypothetical protein